MLAVRTVYGAECMHLLINGALYLALLVIPMGHLYLYGEYCRVLQYVIVVCIYYVTSYSYAVDMVRVVVQYVIVVWWYWSSVLLRGQCLVCILYIYINLTYCITIHCTLGTLTMTITRLSVTSPPLEAGPALMLSSIMTMGLLVVQAMIRTTLLHFKMELYY